MKVVRHRLTALVLVFAITPSVSELVEWGLHAFQHGDFVHAANADHTGKRPGGDSSDSEHGCTALLHSCGCHNAAATPSTEGFAVVVPDGERRHVMPELAGLSSCVADPPPLPPPIA